MTSSEKTTIFFSFLALLVSSLTLYYSEFRQQDEVEVVVLEADPAGGKLTYQVALLNQGNRPAILKSANLKLKNNEAVLAVNSPFSKIDISPKLPLIVEKGKILVLTFSGPLSLDDLYDRGLPPDSTKGFDEFDGEKTRKVLISASFEAMDSSGKLYDTETPPLKMHITRAKVATWDKVGGKQALLSK